MSQKDTILLLRDKSEYGRKDILLTEMKQWFEENGFLVQVAEHEELSIELPDIDDDSLRLILSMDTAGFELVGVSEDPWFNLKKCLCVSLLYDKAMKYREHFVRLLGWNVLLDCFDGQESRYVSTYYGDVIDNVKTKVPFVNIEKDLLPFNQRTIEILVPAKYKSSAEILKDIQALPGIFAEIAGYIIEILLKNREVSLFEALTQYLEQISFPCDKEEFITILENFEPVIEYVRAKQIEDGMNALLELDIPVTVCGPGWTDSIYAKHEKITILGGKNGLPYQTLKEILCKTKIVFHPQTMCREGIHERLLLSAGHGAIVITEKLNAIEKFFVDGTEIFLYSEETMKEDIQGYITQSGEEYLANVAAAGQKKASTLGNMDAYLSQLLALRD